MAPRPRPATPATYPQPVAMGWPGCGYPWPWSVYRWIDGGRARSDRIAVLPAFAARLAGFLVALQAIGVGDGPVAGTHSFFRGGPVNAYDEATREAIDALPDCLDAAAAQRVWEAALAAYWSGPSVWVHGDVAPSNLLVVSGELAAVIDFGCCAEGDPACDLVIAWTLFSGPSRDEFIATVDCDDATWAQARGWALGKALITIHGPTRAVELIENLLTDEDGRRGR